MKNYKRIGDYIQELKFRNTEQKAEQLLGINIDKFFMPSVANVVGTDLSVYKIVKKNQFACNRMHVGRDYRLPISMSKSDKEFMVSPAYDVFEIKDTEVLNPEFLMMWFSRREFDRNAWFYTDADVRGGLPWKSFCDMQLPVPHPHKQREIVKEYNTIVNRIKLNEQLNQKLEETTQTLYKNWFVEFEFPDENGQPYKSNGGEMEWNEELGKDIPKGWKVDDLQKIILFKNGKSKPTKKGKYPVYGGNGIIEYVDRSNDENVIAIGRVGAYCGILYRVLGKCWISDNAISAQSKINANMFSYYVLNNLNLNERSEGTGQPLITQGLLNGIRITIPEKHVINRFEVAAITTFKNQDVISQENQKLTELKELLLSKLATVEN
jgi:type I restriction enzyme S subunit